MKIPLSSLFVLAGLLTAISARAAEPGGGVPKVIKISTAKSAMVLVTSTNGRVHQVHYGAADKQVNTGGNPVRETEFHPQYGDGYILEPALQATHADGNTSTTLTINEVQTLTSSDPNVVVTRVTLKDPAYPFFTTLCFEAFQKEDIIRQWTEIRHDEEKPVTLYRFASSAPLLPPGEYWLTQFRGDFKREAQLIEEKLEYGTKVIDSKIGARASRYRLPSFILSAGGPPKEEEGETYGGSLEWSGSFQFAFDSDWRNRLRALCGINPFASQYTLKPGQVFKTPAMLWTWSSQGKGQVSRNFHRWARQYGMRDGSKPRPVLLNNWEATGMRFDENVIVSLFDGAKEIGADTFLLDDGWFGNKHPRDNDRAGLGDWAVNAKKLPRGLGHLATEAEKRGIKYGIWIEPEMVNPRSELFEQHPDWAIRQPKRDLDLSRFQLVLDLSRPEVREFAWKVVDDALAVPGTTYVKWDANRYITQPGSAYLPPDQQSHLWIDYTFALYDIMDRMAKKYPNIMAMVCSGGGGRVDYGSLKYFHSFWPSDNTDPLARVRIQWGYSHFFPSPAICAHITDMGNRPTKFAVDVAMSGALGLDLDVRKVPADHKKIITDGIKLYKERIRDVVLLGDLYRLESPYGNPRAALNFVSPDRARAVLFVYQVANGAPAAVKPRGLDPQARYRVKEVSLAEGVKSQLPGDGQTFDGATLMRDGLTPACSKEFDSAVIEINREG